MKLLELLREQELRSCYLALKSCHSSCDLGLPAAAANVTVTQVHEAGDQKMECRIGLLQNPYLLKPNGQLPPLLLSFSFPSPPQERF